MTDSDITRLVESKREQARELSENVGRMVEPARQAARDLSFFGRKGHRRLRTSAMTGSNVEIDDPVTCDECGESGTVDTVHSGDVETGDFQTAGMGGFWFVGRNGKIACPDCLEEASDG